MVPSPPFGPLVVGKPLRGQALSRAQRGKENNEPKLTMFGDLSISSEACGLPTFLGVFFFK